MDAILRDHRRSLQHPGPESTISRNPSWREPSILLEVGSADPYREQARGQPGCCAERTKTLRAMFEQRADTLVDRLSPSENSMLSPSWRKFSPPKYSPRPSGSKTRTKTCCWRSSRWSSTARDRATTYSWQRWLVPARSPIGCIINARAQRSQMTASVRASIVPSPRARSARRTADLLVRSFLAAGVDTTINGISWPSEHSCATPTSGIC